MSKPILLFGGGTEERAVAMRSARNVVRNQTFAAYYEIAKDGRISLSSEAEILAFDVESGEDFTPAAGPFASNIAQAVAATTDASFFLIVHGTGGLDAEIRRTLEDLRVPFTGPTSEATLRCGDKVATKLIVAAHGAQIAPCLLFPRNPPGGFESKLSDFLERHGKIVLKPSNSGSSLGLHIVSDPEGLREVIAKTTVFADFPMMAEKFITGRELTVGVFETETQAFGLPPTEIVLERNRIFDFDAKYRGHGVTELFRPELPDFVVKKSQELALLAHRKLGCHGYSRTDMILTDTGLVFLETNGTPGLTATSFIPKQLEVAGVTLGRFIEAQTRLGEARARRLRPSLVG